MRFNRYLWSLYKESSQGADAIRIFGNCSENSDELHSLLFDAGLEMPEDLFVLDFTVPHIANRDPAEIRERFGSDQIPISISKSVKEHLRGHRIDSIDDSREIIEKIVSEGITPYSYDLQGNYIKVLEPNECEWDWEDFPAVTVGLNLIAPDYFLPYFYSRRFNRLADLAQEFDIPLPKIPSKRDRDGRLLYYADLTNHFFEFRTQYGLNISEMSAFLYSFGLNCTPLIHKSDELPQPSKAWFIGAPPEFY